MVRNSFGSFDPRLAAPFVASFEGLRLEAYRCSAGVLTIGYGHTGSDVKPTSKLTKEQAWDLLVKDLTVRANELARYINVPLSQNQYVALLSFAFNLGIGALTSSTLLKRLNEGLYEDAAYQFLRWNKAGGKVLPGLVRRRTAEMELFLKDD